MDRINKVWFIVAAAFTALDGIGTALSWWSLLSPVWAGAALIWVMAFVSYVVHERAKIHV